MKHPIPVLLGTLLGLLMAISCTSEQTTEEQNETVSFANEATQAPKEAWDIPFESHQIDPEEEQEIISQKGSLIKIPAGSLVDADGNPVSGKVQVSYREFHSAADIFRSGIPMRYDSAGQNHLLRSACMFEIKAQQAGKEVFIADGKELSVDIVSQKSGNFNFYKLNEAGDNNWQYLQTASAQPLEKLDEDLLSQKPEEAKAVTKLTKPEKADKDAILFDFKTNYKAYPELAKYEKVLWQDAEKNISGVLNPAENEWIFGEIWEDAKVVPAKMSGNYYYLDLKNENKKARLLVKPVLEGKAYRQALAVYKQSKEETEKMAQVNSQKVQAEQQRIAQLQALQAQRIQFSASFYAGIRDFGTYNWDMIMKKGEMKQLAADFRLENGSQPDEVYLVIPDATVAVKFTKAQWKNFTFSEHWESKVIAVLPDNTFAALEGRSWKASQKKRGTYRFILKEKAKVELPEQLEEFFAP